MERDGKKKKDIKCNPSSGQADFCIQNEIEKEKISAKEDQEDKIGKYWKKIILTIFGFLLALLGNYFIPQKAAVEIAVYRIGGLHFDINDNYRIVLLALMICFLLDGIISGKNEKNRKHYAHMAAFRFVLGIVLLIWDIGGTKLQIFTQPFFPGPAQILGAFLEEGPFIFQNTLYSLRLYAVGFFIGATVGIGTGILIGWFPTVYYWVHPVLHMTGIIPAVAWMPFALTLFPTPFSAAVFLIVICVWFPVASLTAMGIKSTPKQLFEAARILGGGNSYLVFHVAVPHALPEIFSGFGTSNAFAFTTLVMAEMMGQPGGLGYYINLSQVWSAYYKVFAAILVMAILFSFITVLLHAVELRALRWQRGLLK